MLEVLGIMITVLSIVLSPLYSDKLVKLYAHFGFFSPKVWKQATFMRRYSDENYPDEFDVDSWSEDYRVLGITLKNRNQSEIRNVTFRFQVPGGIKDMIVDQVGAHGVSMTPITDRISIGPLKRSGKDVFPASTSVRVHRIEKTGEINLKFLVDISQGENETYVVQSAADKDGESKTPVLIDKILLDFNWEAQSVMLPARRTIDIEDRENLYSDFAPEDSIIISGGKPVEEVPKISLDVHENPEDNPHYEYLKKLVEEKKE